MTRHLLAGTVLAALTVMSAPACGRTPPSSAESEASVPGDRPFQTRIELTHARLFSVEYGDDYAVVRLRAPLQSWARTGSVNDVTEDLVVLTPRGRTPALPPTLAAAPRVEIPLRSIAVNAEADEAFLSALGVADRLIAVGGLDSWDDGIAAKAADGRLAQIGYTWHAPPNLEVLVAHRPDALLTRLVNLDHAGSLERTRALGIAAVPMFSWAEEHYLGQVEWIKLVGLLFGREAESSAYFDRIVADVEVAKRAAADASQGGGRPKVLWAYYGGNQRWFVYNGGREGQLLDDAGADDLARRLEQPWQDAGTVINTERLLAIATDADVWIIGDTHAAADDQESALPPVSVLNRVRAWREGRLFHNYLQRKPDRNAFGWYSTSHLRPDLILRDMIDMFHPGRGPHTPHFFGPFRPASRTAPSGIPR